MEAWRVEESFEGVVDSGGGGDGFAIRGLFVFLLFFFEKKREVGRKIGVKRTIMEMKMKMMMGMGMVITMMTMMRMKCILC